MAHSQSAGVLFFLALCSPKMGKNSACSGSISMRFDLQSSNEIYLFHHGIIHIFDGLFNVDFIGIVGVKKKCLIFQVLQVERFPK